MLTLSFALLPEHLDNLLQKLKKTRVIGRMAKKKQFG